MREHDFLYDIFVLKDLRSTLKPIEEHTTIKINRVKSINICTKNENKCKRMRQSIVFFIELNALKVINALNPVKRQKR